MKSVVKVEDRQACENRLLIEGLIEMGGVKPFILHQERNIS